MEKPIIIIIQIFCYHDHKFYRKQVLKKGKQPMNQPRKSMLIKVQHENNVSKKVIDIVFFFFPVKKKRKPNVKPESPL